MSEMDKELPALLVEYRDLVCRAGDYCPESFVCDYCRRMREIEAELTEALECAQLVNGIREAVQAAEDELITKRRAFQKVTWYRKGGTPEVMKPEEEQRNGE